MWSLFYRDRKHWIQNSNEFRLGIILDWYMTPASILAMSEVIIEANKWRYHDTSQPMSTRWQTPGEVLLLHSSSPLSAP